MAHSTGQSVSKVSGSPSDQIREPDLDQTRDRTTLRSSSVARGLTVLNSVLESGHANAAAISDRASIPLSTVYRYLVELQKKEFVVKRDGGFEVGPMLHSLTTGMLSTEVIAAHSWETLERLRDRTGETAVVVLRRGLHAMVAAQLESPSRKSMVTQENQVLPLYAGSAQRVLLAYAPDSVVAVVVWQGQRNSAASILGERELLDGLVAVKRQGFATSVGELGPNGVGVAVPVHLSDGRVAALSVKGPASRCDANWQTEAIQALTAESDALSSRLASASDVRVPSLAFKQALAESSGD